MAPTDIASRALRCICLSPVRLELQRVAVRSPPTAIEILESCHRPTVTRASCGSNRELRHQRCGPAESLVHHQSVPEARSGIQLARQVNRHFVFVVNYANGSADTEMSIAPLNHCVKGLRGVAMALRSNRECPANFRNSRYVRKVIAVEIRKAQFSDVSSGALALERPIAETRELPMTTVRQQPPPRTLRCGRAADCVPCDPWVSQHGRTVRKILNPVSAQCQPLRFEPRSNIGRWLSYRRTSELS
jgi:hypothetical protein